MRYVVSMRPSVILNSYSKPLLGSLPLYYNRCIVYLYNIGHTQHSHLATHCQAKALTHSTISHQLDDVLNCPTYQIAHTLGARCICFSSRTTPWLTSLYGYIFHLVGGCLARTFRLTNFVNLKVEHCMPHWHEIDTCFGSQGNEIRFCFINIIKNWCTLLFSWRFKYFWILLSAFDDTLCIKAYYVTNIQFQKVYIIWDQNMSWSQIWWYIQSLSRNTFI